MKRWVILIIAGMLGCSSVGCMMTPWSPDPTFRVIQLINQSEMYRQAGMDMGKFMLLDQPNNLNPIQTNGAVGP